MNNLLNGLYKNIYLDPTYFGYSIFMTNHHNFYNNLIHILFGPFMFLGFFLLLKGIMGKYHMNNIRNIWICIHMYCYLRFSIHPLIGYFCILYYYMFLLFMDKHIIHYFPQCLMNKNTYFILGIISYYCVLVYISYGSTLEYYNPLIMLYFYGIIYFFIFNNMFNKNKFINVGICIIIISFFFMEIIGQGLFEKQYNNILYIFNDIYHMPLYTFNSVLNIF